MASKSAGIVIVPPSTAPQSASLHLMPFNIAYTGPARLSLFWNVRNAPEEPEMGESQPMPTTSENSSEAKLAEVDSQESTTSTLVDTPATGLINKAKSLQKRFVAAFRGRKVHGLEISLPPGYSGVVLSAPKGVEEPDDDSKTGAKRKRGATKEDTPAAKKAKPAEKAAARVASDGDTAPVKQLTPAGTFSSFVAWSPDRKFEEKDDQYVRSLDEWVRLSALINATD